jgi:pilus assembly protein FimV
VTDIETQRGVAVQSDEVDPLTESEIYLAYGRSTQAEQTLRDAILRTPDRIELKLKLLEVLTVLARVEAFQELAVDVRDLVVPGSPEEAHLDKLIREFKPDDSGDVSEAETIPAGAVIDLPDRAGSDDVPVSSSAVPAPFSPDEGIVFELDSESGSPSASLAQEPASEAFRVGQTIADASGSLELELEPPLPDVTFTQTVSGNQGALALDSPVPEDPLTAVDEVTSAIDNDNEEKTQLELANAYLEMGDPAAAREILAGLSLSQDPSIKERAQALLEEARR